jgi:ABC-type oligopeptide transport system ATPase subunit
MIRAKEIDHATETMLNGLSLMLFGDEGCGKTTIAKGVKTKLEAAGKKALLINYQGSIKVTLENLCNELAIDTKKTIEQMKDEVRNRVIQNNGDKPYLICDNAERYPIGLRYWLEEIASQKGILLLLATKPPRKDIYLKMPRTALQPIATEQIREVMRQEAEALGTRLTLNEISELLEKVGGNPQLARRAVREMVLGIAANEAGDHTQYIDGTPGLIALISCVGIVRFVGLGLGDKSLYIIGGIATISAITLRLFFNKINRRDTRITS